jgi:predicted amidophosphoribosyltransferase
MQYLNCPRCHAELPTGLLYATIECCPRCGAELRQPQPGIGERLRAAVSGRPRAIAEAPDWEEITRSQYNDRRYVSRLDGEGNGTGTDVAA